MMVDGSLPLIAMNAAAPEGAPPRRINDETPLIAPPCLGEALRRGTIAIGLDSWV